MTAKEDSKIQYYEKHSANVGDNFTEIKYSGPTRKDYRGKTLLSDYVFYSDGKALRNHEKIFDGHLMQRDFPEEFLPDNMKESLKYFRNENHVDYVFASNSKNKLKLLFEGVNDIEFKHGFLMHDTDNENDAFKLSFVENEETGNMDLNGYYDLKDLVTKLDGIERGYHFQIHGENTFSFKVDGSDEVATYFLVNVLDWDKGEIEYYPFDKNVRELVDGFAILGWRKSPADRYSKEEFDKVYKLLEDGNSFQDLGIDYDNAKGNNKKFETYRDGKYFSYLDKENLYLKSIEEREDGFSIDTIKEGSYDKVGVGKDDNNWVSFYKRDKSRDLIILDGGNIVWEGNEDKEYSYRDYDGMYVISYDSSEHGVKKNKEVVFLDENKNVLFKIEKFQKHQSYYYTDKDFENNSLYAESDNNISFLEHILMDRTDYFTSNDELVRFVRSIPEEEIEDFRIEFQEIIDQLNSEYSDFVKDKDIRISQARENEIRKNEIFNLQNKLNELQKEDQLHD
ncbi:MAG: hypothetical protein N4A44_00345 [Alphaproteobacteria bacterium]|jgi:hypothetical protein|nr:hypothetical protein [Alphaproteobacteria bacterium]